MRIRIFESGSRLACDSQFIEFDARPAAPNGYDSYERTVEGISKMSAKKNVLAWAGYLVATIAVPFTGAGEDGWVVSDDGLEMVRLDAIQPGGGATRGGDAPFGTTPDWQNTVRMQVGALQIADMNGDGWNDVIVGCYISNSFPPYDDWHNLIYYNHEGTLETVASWVSADEVSTGDIQVGDINGDTYPDIFSANGGGSMDPSVIYFGSAAGPSTTPGWTSAEPMRAWNNYAILFDFDHDGDTDVFTANQGNSPTDPYRPMYLFRNEDGALDVAPSWQSQETSIQNFLAFGDLDGDGWEDLAVSKWANFQSGVYRNVGGSMAVNPMWTTGATTTDKGVAWGDVNGDQWPDLALGHNPTLLYSNDKGALSQVWAGAAPYYGHSDIRFCDVDLDGDPDLAEIHFSDGRAHIYMNRGGVLDTAPSWTYDATIVGTAIAFGDIDGDGFPDMVTGYSGDACVRLFLNTLEYACPGDLDGDGQIGLSDLTIQLAHFGQTGTNPEDGDLDGDGDVDLADLTVMLSIFGSAC